MQLKHDFKTHLSESVKTYSWEYIQESVL